MQRLRKNEIVVKLFILDNVLHNYYLLKIFRLDFNDSIYIAEGKTNISFLQFLLSFAP